MCFVLRRLETHISRLCLNGSVWSVCVLFWLESQTSMSRLLTILVCLSSLLVRPHLYPRVSQVSDIFIMSHLVSTKS